MLIYVRDYSDRVGKRQIKVIFVLQFAWPESRNVCALIRGFVRNDAERAPRKIAVSRAWDLLLPQMEGTNGFLCLIRKTQAM